MASLLDFDSLWDYDDPAGTEQKFRGLLSAAAESDDLDYRLQLMTQVARTFGLQGRFDEAHNMLDEVESHMAAGDARTRVRYLLERGRVFNSSAQRERARPLFERAFEVAQNAGEDFYAIDAAHMIAIVEPSPEAQLAWNLRGLTLAEKTDDERAQKWPGSLHNNIGWTYHDGGDYAQALAHFEQALVWRQKMGDTTTIRIAEWCVARALRSLGRIDEALTKQQNLLREHERAGTNDGYVLEEVAECLYALDRKEEARPYFTRAYVALSQDDWLVAHEAERLDRLKTLSQ